MSFDLLSDILRESGLQRRLLDLRRLADGDALRFPCERSIGLHVVTQGRLWLHAPALPEPLALGAGDVAFMARGCTHVLSTRAEPDAAAVASVTEIAAALPEGDAPGAGSAVISGAYQLWNTPLHPLFAQLPPWHVLRADSLPRLAPVPLVVGLLQGELGTPQLGSTGVVHGLLDALFTYVLRTALERDARDARGAAGFAQAALDPLVSRAVTRLHADCARPWTLELLAAEVGLSRTTLAQRFRSSMGDTPLNYLRTVRMQRAMRLLADTRQTLEQVAQAVGYQDAFGFSKVFKRTVGVSPREFRRRDEAERALPYRFAAA